MTNKYRVDAYIGLSFISTYKDEDGYCINCDCDLIDCLCDDPDIDISWEKVRIRLNDLMEALAPFGIKIDYIDIEEGEYID